MKYLHKIGKRWIEFDEDEPKGVECDPRLIIWLGVMLAILNILLAFLVMR